MNSKEANLCDILWPPPAFVEIYADRLREIQRFKMPDGSPVVYAPNIEDNDWQHTVDSVSYAYHLAARFPSLRNYFKFDIIIPLLWIHEVDELLGRPDAAKCPGDGWQHDSCLVKDKVYSLEEIEGIKDILVKSGFEEKEVPLWLKCLEGMERPKTCKDPDLLFTKLIDWQQAGLLAAHLGEFKTDDQREKAYISFSVVSGPLFKRLLEIVHPQSPEAAVVIRDEMLYHHDRILREKGVDLGVEDYIPGTMKS